MTEPCDLSAIEARRLIGAKKLSPVELLDSCLARIEAVNPAVNCIVAMDVDRARVAALNAEAALTKEPCLPALHGLPVGIKDMNETEGLTTTYGSTVFARNVPTQDDTVVARIKSAGGIVLAKTNTPEWAAGANTVNPVYGATVNPFDTAKTCGGSSGGSAVALATAMVPLANGSDLGGSLRTPAAYCGVAGFRSTPGLVADATRKLGWAPLSVEGAMGRSIQDLSLLLASIAGADPLDPIAFDVDRRTLHPLPNLDLCSLRVAVSTDLGFAPIDRDIAKVFAAKIALFSSFFRSCEQEDPKLKQSNEIFEVLRAGLFAANFARTDINTLGPNVRANVEMAERFSFQDYAVAQMEHTALQRRFAQFFDAVDLLIAPTAAVSPFPVETLFPETINGEKLRSYFHWIGLTFGLTLTGHPVAVIPCGRDHLNMPFGIQICGRRGADAYVLAAAAAMEAAFADIPDLARPTPDIAALSRRAA